MEKQIQAAAGHASGVFADCELGSGFDEEFFLLNFVNPGLSILLSNLNQRNSQKNYQKLLRLKYTLKLALLN